MAKIINIAGQRFGRLVAIEQSGIIEKSKIAVWKCVCDCGEIVFVAGTKLRFGWTKSCGCLQKEKASEFHFKHGYTSNVGNIKSKTYNAWAGLIARCTNKNDKNYKHYGGRGITVCEAWKQNFTEFLADMGECPKGYSIERRDVNGNYCKENCCWIPRGDQAKNTTKTVRLLVDGHAMIQEEASKYLGIPTTTLHRYVKGMKIKNMPSVKIEIIKKNYAN